MDGSSSYAMFLYLDEGIHSASASRGGYDASDGVNLFATVSAVIDIETTTNVYIPGMYIFQLSYPPGKVSRWL